MLLSGSIILPVASFEVPKNNYCGQDTYKKIFDLKKKDGNSAKWHLLVALITIYLCSLGYFTSKPSLKLQERLSARDLAVCKQVSS
jgi:hypothetical protein